MKSILRIVGIVFIAVVIMVIINRNFNLPVAQAKPPVPVELTFRKALIGSGAVAQFKNNSGKLLSVEVKFSNPTFHTSKVFDFVLDPGKPLEIGHLEGWTMASGDTVEVSSSGFVSSRTILQ